MPGTVNRLDSKRDLSNAHAFESNNPCSTYFKLREILEKLVKVAYVHSLFGRHAMQSCGGDLDACIECGKSKVISQQRFNEHVRFRLNTYKFHGDPSIFATPNVQSSHLRSRHVAVDVTIRLIRAVDLIVFQQDQHRDGYLQLRRPRCRDQWASQLSPEASSPSRANARAATSTVARSTTSRAW